MIRDILDFFRKEKFYGVFFILIVAVYAFLMWRGQAGVKNAEQELQINGCAVSERCAERNRAGTQTAVKSATLRLLNGWWWPV